MESVRSGDVALYDLTMTLRRIREQRRKQREATEAQRQHSREVAPAGARATNETLRKKMEEESRQLDERYMDVLLPAAVEKHGVCERVAVRVIAGVATAKEILDAQELSTEDDVAKYQRHYVRKLAGVCRLCGYDPETGEREQAG